MSRDPRHDILFEPVRLGPVTAPNRFYQVPHCTGMGWQYPRMLAAMRGVKAEGGWGVVCTEYCSIHPGADDLPHPYASLWDAGDVRAHALMTEAVHAHGALAGVELWYGGASANNLFSRLPTMDLGSVPNAKGHPFQSRIIDRADIRDLRRWHRKAALRAREAGFDIVYVYATHGYLLANFLNPRINTRADEYGGSLENRVRLIRELIEETKEAVGDRCAVAVRFAADDETGADGAPITGERREMFEMLAPLPDLWDINIADYTLEMGASRFVKEAALEPYMAWVKSVTDKPVVTVGRFTAPDTMAGQVRRGITDFIGAARPSIADPFLPRKIAEGRLGEIRECIGCNICYACDSIGVPLRCTQNPTMGEEWRRGWHPESIAPAPRAARVLVVGAGPAGLEAARALGQRGYEVMLAEATRDLGGRVTREAALPGMSEYARVRDYRVQQLDQMDNVGIFRESRLGARDVLDLGVDHVALATGAHWRAERFDGETWCPVASAEGAARLFTPDDIMSGRLPDGPTLVYDEEGYYMASVIAERLHAAGIELRYVTPADNVAPWARYTSERLRIQARLVALGIGIVTARRLVGFDGAEARLDCAYGGPARNEPAQNVVMVTGRRPEDALYHALLAAGGDDGLPFTLQRIGDCAAPAIIAAAVHAGHCYARELDAAPDPDRPLRHDRVDVAHDAPRGASRGRGMQHGYLETLQLYYEEEIEGEAYFAELARVFADPGQKARLTLLARVEAHAARGVAPLIARHGLAPRDAGVLVASGRAEARATAPDWAALIAAMQASYPGYLAAFRRLETMGPPEDRPWLDFLSAHEVAALDFLAREAAGAPDSCAPLERYLASAPPTAQGAG